MNENATETSAILSKTGWVEIVLTHTNDEQNPLRVDVEIAPFDLGIKLKDHCILPKIMTSCMEYLLNLLNLGFNLQLADEGVWIASKCFGTTPKRKILKALIPPKVERYMPTTRRIESARQEAPI
ncbi:MAG: hypothetical protein EAX95_07005 [Candidatus Thorarchaeota archaeon]|nr:hypothetical protein [Candidatus Thorarchaeota archaeon]